MTKSIFKSAAVAVAFAVSAVAAQAATFNFTGAPNSNNPSLSYTVDGIGLTVTAQSYLFGAPLTVNTAAEGLGVRTSGLDNSNQIDGFGVAEVLIFSFDREVELKSVAFSLVHRLDTFSFFVGADTPWDLTEVSFASDFDLSGYTGTVFGIGTINPLSAFRIASIEAVDAAPAPVPVPAAAFALMGGLGALTALRRRRR